MPVDLKRINGPENSVPYHLFVRSKEKSFREKEQAAINPAGLRKSGRRLLDHRKMYIKTGVVTQAKGSAYIEIGKTKVMASVFDPREIPNKIDYSQKGELYCEFKYATFSGINRRMHQQDTEEKQNSIIIKQALEPAVCLHEFPNFQIDIYILVLENDGASISAAITCAGIALVHAAVPMYDLISACTLGIVNGVSILDPTLEEECLCDIAIAENKNRDHGLIVLSILATQQQISQYYQTGKVGMENITRSTTTLMAAAHDVVGLIEKCIVKHVMRQPKPEEKKL